MVASVYVRKYSSLRRYVILNVSNKTVSDLKKNPKAAKMFVEELETEP
jgi:hypothetical protein